MPRSKERQAAITWLMPLGTIVQFMLPRWVIVRIANVAGALAHRFDRRGREGFTENCRHILGPGTPESQIRATTRRLFFHYVLYILDLMRVPVVKRRVTALVEFDRRDADRMMAEGHGLVVVTGHIGSHDLAGTFLAASGYPISAVVEHVPHGWTRTFNRYRQATAMETIPTTDRAGIARAMLRRQMLALVSDRDLTGKGILCPAFDSYRYYPKGPAAYTLRLKPRIVLAWCVFQHKPGRPPYSFDYEPLEFAPTGNKDADVVAFTRVIAAALNDVIRKFPDQWLVFDAAWQQP